MLKNYIAIYVPGTRVGNSPLDSEVKTLIIRKIAGELSDKFGGASAYPIQGFWLSDVHGLIEESITVIKSYYDDTIPSIEALEFAHHIARGLKTELQQEAVTVETESGIDFI